MCFCLSIFHVFISRSVFYHVLIWNCYYIRQDVHASAKIGFNFIDVHAFSVNFGQIIGWRLPLGNLGSTNVTCHFKELI